MENLVDNSVVVLVYTSMLMFVLRFFAGPIVHRLNPIGLLLASSVIAVLGLLWLGTATESLFVIFAAATLYSLGKAFLWPTMLAVAGERYPQSGSVAMSALGAVGMISVGTVGGTMIGAQQSESMVASLETNSPETFERYYEGTEGDFLGYTHRSLSPVLQQAAMEGFRVSKKTDDPNRESEIQSKVEAALGAVKDDADRKEQIGLNFESDSKAVATAYDSGSRQALRMTAMIPVGMAVGFLLLAIYYKSIGGYKVIRLDENGAEGNTDDAGEESSE
jgi:hypothetical protein